MLVFERQGGYNVASWAFGPLGQTARYLMDAALQLFAMKGKPSFIVYLTVKEYKHLKQRQILMILYLIAFRAVAFLN